MRLLAALALTLTPLAAKADFALSDLIGNWAGSGSYYERPTKTRMQCRLSFAGSDQQVRMSGRCGSSLGAHDLAIDVTRQGKNGVTVKSAPGARNRDSKVDGMTGQMSGNFLIAKGTGGTETVTFQLEKKPDGTLQFVTQREDGSFFSQSVVTLTRR